MALNCRIQQFGVFSFYQELFSLSIKVDAEHSLEKFSFHMAWCCPSMRSTYIWQCLFNRGNIIWTLCRNAQGFAWIGGCFQEGDLSPTSARCDNILSTENNLRKHIMKAQSKCRNAGGSVWMDGCSQEGDLSPNNRRSIHPEARVAPYFIFFFFYGGWQCKTREWCRVGQSGM